MSDVYYLIYDDEASAQQAADDIWAKYGPTVHETDMAGNPTGKTQVTQSWAKPIQRDDKSWMIQDQPTFKVDPVNAAKSVEVYDASWIDVAAALPAEATVGELP